MSIFLLLATLLLNVAGVVFSQSNPCITIRANHFGDKTTFFTDPDTFSVLVKPGDQGPDLTTKKTPCLNVLKSGFYKIAAKVVYSEGQDNESFYLTVLNQFTPQTDMPVCNPNAGPFKVIPDLAAGPLGRNAEADTTRNVGLYYFEAGIDTIQLNHYFNIQNQYPDFLNTPGQPIKPEDIESVHISRFDITFIASTAQVYDIQLRETASVDTAQLTQPVDFAIQITNNGPGTAYEVVVADTLPRYFQITAFNQTPDSIKDNRILFWNFDSLNTKQSEKISLTGNFITDVQTPFLATNKAFVTSLCDTNSTNNRDSSRVTVIAKKLFSDIALRQTVIADSMSISETDTTYFTKPGGTITYRINVQNISDVAAENIVLFANIPPFTSLKDSTLTDTLQWKIKLLPAFQDTLLSYEVQVDTGLAPGTYTIVNNVSGFAENEAPDKLTNNSVSSTVLLTVQEKPPPILPDLAVSQYVRTDSFVVQDADTLRFADSGDSLTYFISVRNLTAAQAENAVLHVQFSDFLLTEFSPDTSAEITLGKLKPLADTSLVLVGQLKSDLPEGLNTIQTFVSISADNEDPNALNNNRDSTTVFNDNPPPPISYADLAVRLSVKTDSFAVQNGDTLRFVDAGDSLIYVVAIENLTDTEAENTTLHLQFSGLLETGFPADTSEITLGNLPPFADTAFAVRTKVKPDLPVGMNLLQSKVFISADNEDPNKLNNNRDSTTVFNNNPPPPISYADLAVRLSVKTDSFAVQNGDTLRFVDAGDSLIYFILVTNLTNTEAKNTKLHLQYSDLLETGFHADTSETTLGNLPPFADTSLAVRTKVKPDLPVGMNLLQSKVIISADNEDPNALNNNRDSTTVFNFTTAPVVYSDLAIWQSVRTDSFTVQGSDTLWFVQPGERYTYMLHILNRENTEAKNVRVFDILPDSVNAISNPSADTLFWNFSKFAGLQDTTLTFHAIVSSYVARETKPLINTAFVEAENEDPNKLSDNLTTQSETLFIIPEKQKFQQSCDFFTLNKNVLKPERGDILTINFELNSNQFTKIDIYDLSGYHIRNLADQAFGEGKHLIQWNATTESGMKVGSGVYIVTLRSQTLTCWKKVILAR